MDFIVIQEKLINLRNIVSIEQSKDKSHIYLRTVFDSFIKFSYHQPTECDSVYQSLIKRLAFPHAN